MSNPIALLNNNLVIFEGDVTPWKVVLMCSENAEETLGTLTGRGHPIPLIEILEEARCAFSSTQWSSLAEELTDSIGQKASPHSSHQVSYQEERVRAAITAWHYVFPKETLYHLGKRAHHIRKQVLALTALPKEEIWVSTLHPAEDLGFEGALRRYSEEHHKIRHNLPFKARDWIFS